MLSWGGPHPWRGVHARTLSSNFTSYSHHKALNFIIFLVEDLQPHTRGGERLPSELSPPQTIIPFHLYSIHAILSLKFHNSQQRTLGFFFWGGGGGVAPKPYPQRGVHPPSWTLLTSTWFLVYSYINISLILIF